MQIAPVVGDLRGNTALALGAVGRAAGLGADIVVLPELATSGYVFASADEARAVAVSAADPLFERWAAAGAGATVVGGFAEAGADGLLYNSAAVVTPDGVVAVYRKTHLWDREKLVFTPGAAAPPVLDTRTGRIAVLICYDLEFPELTRSVALRGAELIVAPTNWPRSARPRGERPGEVVIAMAAARVNRVAVACCDRAGTERGQDWNEATSIISAEGWVVATADGDAPACADLDLGASRDKSLTPLCDLFADRRPELYGAVVDGATP